MVLESMVRYADSGGVQIAYQVIGDGPRDVVMVFEWGSHLHLNADEPRVDRFLRRFAEYARLIVFDLRGSGLSDPVDRLPPLEEWVDDIRAVLAAVGSERAALVGHGHAGQLCMVAAAMHPEQITALVTVNSYARLRQAPDYPCGHSPEDEAVVMQILRDQWGTGQVMAFLNPSMAEGARGPAHVTRLEQSAGSPRRAILKQQLAYETDVRDVLPAISVPTLVTQTKRNPYVVRSQARYLVEHIAGARHLELRGGDHAPFTSSDADLLMDAIEEFLTGVQRPRSTDRALTTVAFTDIVGSTELATTMGDRRWRSLLEAHESAGAGEVLTSSTVRDLVAGSGIAFEDRGDQRLKGVEDGWRVFAAR